MSVAAGLAGCKVRDRIMPVGTRWTDKTTCTLYECTDFNNLTEIRLVWLYLNDNLHTPDWVVKGLIGRGVTCIYLLSGDVSSDEDLHFTGATLNETILAFSCVGHHNILCIKARLQSQGKFISRLSVLQSQLWYLHVNSLVYM